MSLENPIMNRNVSLVLTIIRDAKLPGVRDLRASFPHVQHREAWGTEGNVGLVRLDVVHREAQNEAFDWIARHPDIRVLDQVYAPGSDGITEYVVVEIRDARAANARRNAQELTLKIGKRRTEARKDMDASMPVAMHVDFYMGKLVQWEAERDAWQRIADKPTEFRIVFGSAVADLINGLGTSADALEDALRKRQLEGLRNFVRRARVYMDDQDAVDALLSF